MIEARYGPGVQTYYRFFRWSVLNIWFLAAMWSPVLIIHIMYTIASVWNGSSDMTGFSSNYFPMMFRYGTFLTSVRPTTLAIT